MGRRNNLTLKVLLSLITISLLFVVYLNFASAGIIGDILNSIIKPADTNFSGSDCWGKTGDYASCIVASSSCRWVGNNETIHMYPSCPLNSTNYNSSALSMWVGMSQRTFLNITGNNILNAGCCEFKSSGGGGGAMMGCGSFNGNQTGCLNSSLYGVTGCSWKANDINQNSMCMIKKVGDWGPNGAVNSISNVGCCEMQGCWSYRGNQSLLGAQNCTNVLNGVCSYNAYGNGCPESGGCCFPKSCSEVTTQDKCEQLIQLGNPCTWSGSACSVMSGGGFGLYNTTSSCMSTGGWWNGTACQMPGSGGGMGSGGGGFMFAQDAKCWFADNKASICGNVTGCVFCTNTNSQLNNASSACYNAANASCKGHEQKYSNWNGTANFNVIDINTSAMICGDIKLKKTCSCGPLPNCVWGNSSVDIGNFCTSGMKSDSDRQLCQPPVMFCEDTKAKNNQSLCDLLSSDYMMPCKWDSVNNCTFNNIAVFGSNSGGGGMTDYNSIGSEMSCIAAGGSWKESYYEDSDGSFKQDAWCDKGAMFDFSSGQAFANKGSCDSDCWACEFNSTGGRWANTENASAACRNSAKGYCIFKQDLNAPNEFGWCDYPREFETGGMKDCSSDCKTCEFTGTTSVQAQTACAGSLAGCTWINDTTAMNGKLGYCLSSSKKSCLTECGSCYEQSSCSNSSFHASVNCSWDNSFKFCKPLGFTGEVCFNGIDDDNDGQKDCAYFDCTYDQFCGGANTGGSVDCKKIFSSAGCTKNQTASGTNCTWVTPSWGGQSYCDFPGTSCWMYETNVTACTGGIGCIYRNATAGYPAPAVQVIPKVFTGFCDMNKTKADVCFNPARMNNFTACNASSDCIWVNDSYSFNGGRCDFKPFAICGSAMSSSDCSEMFMGVNRSDFCTWRANSFSSSSGGFCEPSCGGKVQGQCSGLCGWKSSSCEPEAFGGMSTGGGGFGGGGGGCHAWDGNQTGCSSQNVSCAWMSFSQNSSQGICEVKGMQVMMGGMDQGPPKILGNDINDTSIKEIDIREFGIKDSPKSLGFGIVVSNITNGAVCKGYYIGGMMGAAPVLGNGTATTKFYWYLDSDKNISNSCNATKADGSNLTGFEFLIKYTVSLSNQATDEQKSLYKCSSGSWVLTNVALTSNRQFMCGMSVPSFGNEAGKLGGVMILIDKENLQSFAEYNNSAPMRVFISSANDSYNEFSPLDSANPGYYTSGSADFKFVDCSNPNTKDTKCKNFQKFGFNIFEDCKNGKDDDSDGMVDCADPKCKFTPNCASGTAFNFSADANDVQSPTVTFSQVDVLRDSAFVKFDTDEPANGTLEFYGNDSTCNSVNISLNDTGNPTIYYYKTGVCDTSSNCASSSCQNFTTSNEPVKNFIFKMNLPTGFTVDIPQLNYSGNFTKVIGGVLFEVGIKTNASVSRNINISVNCSGQSLTFVGADILKPKSIDMESAFICNSGSNVLGMNSTSKSWNQLVGDIGMGGQSDYIKLTYPVTYSSGNTIKWCDDTLTNCTTVNNYANCAAGGSGKTDCKIPTSLGFSAYQITVPAASPASSSSGGA